MLFPSGNLLMTVQSVAPSGVSSVATAKSPRETALGWSAAAMGDAARELGEARGLDLPQALAVVSEAVWWVTVVHATVVRYHANAYDRNPESSRFLKAFGLFRSREFAELRRWQLGTGRSDGCLVLPGQRRPGGSGCPLGDPRPVAVGVSELEFASIGRRLFFGAAELGHDGVDVLDEQPD